MPDIWEQTLNLIEQKINRESFDTWFSPTSLLDYDGQQIRVAVPDFFFSNWLKEHYSSLISDTLQTLLPGKEVAVAFITAPQGQKEKSESSHKRASSPNQSSRSAKARINKLTTRGSSPYEPPKLNPHYNFSNFVIGASNQFAHAASLSVAEQPSRTYNPLFIYGGVGLGKTHLLHAIGHRILEHKPTARLVYTFAEEFMNALINAIRFDRTAEFRNKFRYMDALLIDDIQFIAGKERTQEEFFHTFNVLYEARKQIVITSDCPPKAIPTLEERLRSRFEWGLIADIQPPDLETKVAIVKKKAEKERIDLPDEVCLLIASNIISNIRELEGSLNRIAAYSAIHGEEITLSLTQKVLKDILQEREKTITLERIQEVVANHFGFKVSDLKSKTRSASLVQARQIAMYICKAMTNHSFPKIARAFGGRDHTTVIHAHNKISNLLEKNSNIKKQVSNLIDHIQRT